MAKHDPTPRTKSGLTPLQENFCHEYLVDHDPGKAFIRAGYSVKAKDEKTRQSFARRNGRKLLEDHRVDMRIQQLTEQRNRSTDVTAERVVLELARIGFSDLRNFMSWGPGGATWNSSDQLTDDSAAVVQEIYETEREMDGGGVYRTKRFKLYDKMSALKELAKHTGVGQDAGVNVNVNVEAEKAMVGEIEALFREIDDYRDKNEQSLPEEKLGSEPA